MDSSTLDRLEKTFAGMSLHGLFLSFIVMAVSLVPPSMFSVTVSSLQFVQAQDLNSEPNPTNGSLAAHHPNRSQEHAIPMNRIFYIYNTNVLGFNETRGINQTGLVSDQFSLQTIIVNQGDNVTVNFYNMEAKSGDRHSFTIDAPYNVNIDVAPGQNGTANFVAGHTGIFKFYCKYHAPGMAGELSVLPVR